MTKQLLIFVPAVFPFTRFILFTATTFVLLWGSTTLHAQNLPLHAAAAAEEFDIATFEELLSLSEVEATTAEVEATEIERELVEEQEQILGDKPLFGTKSKKMVRLPAGTLIYLELNERVAMEQTRVGKVLQFKVKMNVVKDRKILVTTGAMALGRVKAVQPSSYNYPAELTIELVSVQAVDGQQIALVGNEQTYSGHQSPLIPAGTSIPATVTNDMNISAL